MKPFCIGMEDGELKWGEATKIYSFHGAKIPADKVEIRSTFFRGRQVYFVAYRDEDEDGRMMELRGQLFATAEHAEHWASENISFTGKIEIKSRAL